MKAHCAVMKITLIQQALRPSVSLFVVYIVLQLSDMPLGARTVLNQF